MAEWHLTPEYILHNWTEEKLSLMLDKLIERKKVTPKGESTDSDEVSNEVLFAQMGSSIKVVR